MPDKNAQNLRVGDLIDLKVDRMTYGSAAVGRINTFGSLKPLVIFVEGAVPGERVRARLKKHHKSYWEAELVEVLTSSPDRKSPECQVFSKCGGCQWQHLNYPAQLRSKAEILIHQLNRATRRNQDELHSKLTVHGAKNPYHYRARMQIHGDKLGIGFFAEQSHSIVHTDACPVAHIDIQKTWTEFLRSGRAVELSRATGIFKIEWTREDSGQIKEAINRKHGAFGFTQVNPEQNSVLVDLVTQHAGGGQVVLDLYGGNGNLSNSLLDKYKQIVSVDSFNEGQDPVQIQGPLGAGRVFVRENVEDFLLNQRWRDWNIQKIDCVIADPPRNGMCDASLRVASLNASRIILVSCDPSTLARDLTAFQSYEIESLHLVDMFPQTYHMETVVVLCKTAKAGPEGPALARKTHDQL